MGRWYALAACRGASVAVFFPEDDDYRAARQVCATCRGASVAVFFPEDDDFGAAREVCATCPVRRPCLEEAQRFRIEFGMFGGLTPAERRATRRRGRAA